MREILFRAKRSDNGKWIFGDLLTPTDFLEIFEISVNTGDGDRYDIDPDTICQYTGLKDKNGKKIFEGDIVSYDTGNSKRTNGNIHEVVFETRGGSAYFGIKLDEHETWQFCMEVPTKLMEVIGNIYDNPELLKEEG